jgi:threonine/homoserine/homoserine lactone efflux protein
MTSLLIRGFALGFAIAASPGPIFFLCLRRTLLGGWTTGLASGLGVATADGFYAAIAVFGIAALSGALMGGERWLEMAGGVALIVIGLRSLLERPNVQKVQRGTSGSGLAWAYASTFGLTITNPATIISFAALAAALGAGLNGGFARPAVVVVGVALGSAAWWCLLAALGAVLRARVTPAVARAIGMVSGLAIAGLGALALAAAIAT